MNKRKLLEVVLVVQICLCLQHVTYGNRNGAPSSACDNMTPSHGPNPQQTSNPYTVTLNTTSYTYGTIVNGKNINYDDANQIQLIRSKETLLELPIECDLSAKVPGLSGYMINEQ